jgi:hypothetical protein
MLMKRSVDKSSEWSAVNGSERQWRAGKCSELSVYEVQWSD